MFTTNSTIARLRRRVARLVVDRDRLRCEAAAAEATSTAARESLQRMIATARGVEEVMVLARPAPKQVPITEQTTRRR